MKLSQLLESKQDFLKAQQLLIEGLGDEWDVQIGKSWLFITNTEMPGPVWFGPVDYSDLPDPIDTKADVEREVKANYEDTGIATVKVLEARCRNISTCETSIKVESVSEAFRAICIYNGWGISDLADPDTAGDAIAHLETDVRPA